MSGTFIGIERPSPGSAGASPTSSASFIGGGNDSYYTSESPLSASPSTSAESPSRYITVVDVYDLAESINRDFEALNSHLSGKESLIETLVRKVVSALETLEALAKRNNDDNAERLELQRSVERLQSDKVQRARDKENLERDFADLEEAYKAEIGSCHLRDNLSTQAI